MSVILATGRKTAKKLREGTTKQTGKQTSNRPRTASEPPNRSYKPTPTTIVWNHTMNNTKLSFAFSSTTMVLWCNDHPIETRIEFTDDGSQRDFVILDRKGCLLIRQSECSLKDEDSQSYEDVVMNDKEDMLPQQSSDGAKAISGLVESQATTPGIIYELYIDGQFVPQTLSARK